MPQSAALSHEDTTAHPPKVRTELEVVQEVRFAVVMYGGVSLAIYINGVTQELLNLVRATAYASGENPAEGAFGCAALSPVEKVYRKLAYLSGSESLRRDYREWLAQRAPDAGGEGQARDDGVAPAVDSCLEKNEPLSTRFVVDILSGTSAGGINAIFLAKALSNDKQIGGLKDMWVTEGDLGKLINDRGSLDGMNNVGLVDPPRSLLNSRRMYLKLLNALSEVDRSKGGSAPATGPVGSENSPSPLVDELDLFVTTTDIHGVPLPVRLSDRVVYERRYRNVFHFRYADGTYSAYKNDLTDKHSPFLAFAARCTSSFPFAFEPMSLSDIDCVVEALPGHEASWGSANPQWQRYFTESLSVAGDASKLDFTQRAFGDGGYLDNKPFTYVTDTLSRRYSDVPVRRKLLYIEPSPEHPEDERADAPAPNALENVVAALLTLPRQETIREDLQRLLDRNRLIERADRTLDQVRNDVTRARNEHSGERRAVTGFADQKRDFWPTDYLPDTVKRFGKAYVAYRRMRIADATDELSRCFTSQAGFDVHSDEFLAIRAIVHIWRVRNYADYKNDDDIPSVNAFLNDFDVGFRVRRMTFIRRQIDLLHRMTDSEKHDLENGTVPSEIRMAYQQLRGLGFDYDLTWKSKFKEALKTLKGQLNVVEHSLQRARAAVEAGTLPGAPASATAQANPDGLQLGKAITTLGISGAHLKYILGMEWKVVVENPDDPVSRRVVPGPDATFARSVTNDDREKRAAQILDEPTRFDLAPGLRDELGDVAQGLKQRLCRTFDEAYSGVESLLSESSEPLYAYLWKEFLAFEDYDQVTFPILFGTNVGEAEPVEIFRVSPEDAVSVIDERRDEKKRRKLAGVALFNFGGFLDEAWRENDVLWGRLDGAERLVTSVLPDPEDESIRADLTRQLHEEILADLAQAAQARKLGERIASSMMRKFDDASPDGLRMAPSEQIANQKAIAGVVNSTLSRAHLLEFMRKHYTVDRRLDPKPVLDTISRATQVIGKMFEDMASRTRASRQSRHLTWIARLGSVFWGLVQLAVPGSIGNLLFYHWFKLLVAVEGLILAGGLLLNQPAAVHFGWLSLLITLLVGLTVTILRDMMLLKHRWLRVSFSVVVLAVLGFALLGVDAVFGLEWFTPFYMPDTPSS